VETREIDMRLQQYTAAEHRIGANLQELEQHAVYQLLMTDVLTGATARALKTVTEADPGLWELFTLLSSALDSARRLRGTGSRINNSDRLALASQLSTDSVVVTTENVPLGERGLTGGASRQERMSIDDLISHMSDLYEPVRDVVSHAETVLRSVLPRLNSAEGTVKRLRTESQTLGLTVVELDRIEQTIARVRELSLTDPLSIPPDSRETFDDAIHAASAVIAAARSSHDQLTGDIAAASDLLDECRNLIEQASRHRAEAIVKIARPVGLRIAPSADAIDGPSGLASRLDPILSLSAPWQHVRQQLDTWSMTASRFRDQLSGVVRANGMPLRKRDELRGRLAAFRAKMAATGYSEDPVLRDMSAEAHNELFTSPTDLARAEQLVNDFGARLAAT